MKTQHTTIGTAAKRFASVVCLLSAVLAFVPSAEAYDPPPDITPYISTDNEFETEYNPFALPNTMAHWMSALVRHECWTNYAGGNRGFQSFWNCAGTWFLATNHYYTVNMPSNYSEYWNKVTQTYFPDNNFLGKDNTCLAYIQKAAEAKVVTSGKLTDDAEIGENITVALCQLLRPHEYGDPYGHGPHLWCCSNHLQYVDTDFRVVRSSSFASGLRIDATSWSRSNKIARFDYFKYPKRAHLEENVAPTAFVEIFYGHYSPGISNCIETLNRVSDDWTGTYLLHNRDYERTEVKETVRYLAYNAESPKNPIETTTNRTRTVTHPDAWPALDEDVYLDRGDVLIMKSLCHVVDSAAQLLRAYELPGQKSGKWADPVCTNIVKVQENMHAIGYTYKTAWITNHLYRVGYSDRIERAINDTYHMLPDLFASIDDDVALAGAREAYLNALECFLDADAFITGKAKSKTGKTITGQRDPEQLHLIEFDEESQDEKGIAGWREFAEKTYASLTGKGTDAAVQTLDMVDLGKKLDIHVGSRGDADHGVLDFSSLGSNRDGKITFDANAFFDGQITRNEVILDGSAITTNGPGYMVATRWSTARSGGGDRSEGEYPYAYSQRLHLNLSPTTVSTTLNGLYPSGTLISDLATMKAQFPADGAELRSGFAQMTDVDVTTCKRTELESGESTNLVAGTYTAAPTAEMGGAFKLCPSATLIGTNVTFVGNEATAGGAIYVLPECIVKLVDAVFENNKSSGRGGAIYNGAYGELTLENVTFRGNSPKANGGAIANLPGGTVKFDGTVTLATETDTIYNTRELASGTLNWNLANGKHGLLNGYQNIYNTGTLKITVDDAIVAPTNIVIATGNFSDIDGKDTFKIADAAGCTANLVIDGEKVACGTRFYQLKTEAAGATTNLVLSVPPPEPIPFSLPGLPWNVTTNVYTNVVSEATRVDANVMSPLPAFVVYNVETATGTNWYFRGDVWTKAITNKLDTTQNPAVDPEIGNLPELIAVTCERKTVDGYETLEEGKTYTAAPTDQYGGAFSVSGTLVGTNVTFRGNEVTYESAQGGAIYIQGSHPVGIFEGATFDGNKATGEYGGGGAICNAGGTLYVSHSCFTNNSARGDGGALYNYNDGVATLDEVIFSGNSAKNGGAIYNAATLNFDGSVTLATDTDILYNLGGTLNWNLADGKRGLLNGYDKLQNYSKGTLQITIDDAITTPTNIVIATGDFTKTWNKNTFTITNALGGAALGTVTINGAGVGDENLAYGVKLVEEEPAGSGVTNLVLTAFEPLCRVISEYEDTTNYFETAAAAVAAAKDNEKIQFLRSAEIDVTVGAFEYLMIDLNGQFITNKYLSVSSEQVQVLNSMEGVGGLVNTGIVVVANGAILNMNHLDWGAGGFMQSPNGSGKFVIADGGKVYMQGLSPNWMEANAPGSFSGSDAGAKVVIGIATYTKDASGIWATEDAVAAAEVASTGTYDQGTIYYNELFTDLQKAIDSVTTNGTVTLLKATLTYKLSVTNDYACTLDLNGKSILDQDSTEVRSPLTICDDSGTQGTASGTQPIVTYTNLTIKGGVLDNMQRDKIVVQEGARVDISGGTICHGYTPSANVFISGGTFAYVKPDATNIVEGFVCYQTAKTPAWTVTQGVKLSNVGIDGTSNVVELVDYPYPFDAGKDGYLVPSNQAVTITYKADDDHMFGLGWKERTITIDADTIGGGYDMTDDPSKASVADKVADRWVEGDGGRDIALDTRERIVVAAPEEVLPIAYSTNYWGESSVTGIKTMVYHSFEGKDILAVTNTNGYLEWMPTSEQYGCHTIGMSWIKQISEQAETNAFIYYSQPYALTWTAEGEGKITVKANTMEAGTVLGYDFVNVVATPNAERVFKGWTLMVDGEDVTSEYFENRMAVTNRFEMPCEDAVLTAEFTAAKGCTVNGEDIAAGEGHGWSMWNGDLILESNIDDIDRFELSGRFDGCVKATPLNYSTNHVVLVNFTNDVSGVSGKHALKASNYGTVQITLVGENYLAASPDKEAIWIKVDTEITGEGSLTAIPGPSSKILPAIKEDGGKVRITGGTFNSTVDPKYVPEDKRLSGFSNGDGTWTVKPYVEVWCNENNGYSRYAWMCVSNDCLGAGVPDPVNGTQAFEGWYLNGSRIDLATYRFSADVPKDNAVTAHWTTSNAAYVDAYGVTNYAQNVESAITNAPAGGTVDVSMNENKVDVKDVDKSVVIVGSRKEGLDVTTAEGSGLEVSYSTNNVDATVIAVVGEKVDGIIVSEPNQLATETKTVEKPDGIETATWIEATNAVSTVSSTNLNDLVGEKAVAKAVAEAKADSAVAIVTEVKLIAEPVAAEEDMYELANFTFDVKPVMTVYGVKDGSMTNVLLAVTNDTTYLEKKPVTVTIQLSDDFVPMFITHTHDDGQPEYFLHPTLPLTEGEKHFTYDAVAKTVTLTMSEFSKLMVYKSVPKSYIVTMDATEKGYIGSDYDTHEKMVDEYIEQGVYRFLETPKTTNDLVFAGWYYGETKVENGDAFATNDNHKVTAKWNKPEQTVTVTAGAGGTARATAGVVGGKARVGATVTVTATADTNWQFAGWTGTLASSANPYSFTMPDSAVTLTANFEVSAAYRQACEDQVNSNRVEAIEELNKLALTDSEKAAYLAEINETANKALLTIRAAGTPALVKAAADASAEALDAVVTDAEETAKDRVGAWDIGAELAPAVKAELTDEGELIISGIGPMKDFAVGDAAPWTKAGFASNIVEVTVSSNITYIGSYAFAGCAYLETVDLTEVAEFNEPFFGTGVFVGTEGVVLKVATVEAYKALSQDESYLALDPKPAISAPPVPFEFAKTAYETTEGEELQVVVFGGKSDRSTAVTVNFIKGTYTAKPTAYLCGKKVSFPITLDFERGEIGTRVITLVTKTSKSYEEDRAFTLELGSPAANEVGEACVASVVVHDAVAPTEPAETNYVRAIAWPFNGGTVSGAGTLKNEKSKLTLKAKEKKNVGTFAGWYLPMTNNVNLIDTNACISLEKNLKVGYGTEYGAGTYYAYFVEVLPVASVDDSKTAETAKGATYEDGVYCFKVGMYAELAFGLDDGTTDGSGKGTLTVSSLPIGLKYDKKTGLIYGTPKKACTKSVKVVAKNAAGKQTVYYTFYVEALPAEAVGTWNGLVRSLDEEGPHAGCGTVQFTASSSGKLSAKVTTRLTGTKSFSATSYTLVSENVYAVEMETSKGEAFSAMLYLTNDWKTAQLVGTVTGGKFADNDEEVKFTAIRNAFNKKDKNQDALDFLSAYKGTYEDVLYVEGEEAGSVTFKVQDSGKVQVKAKSVNGTYSATCAGAFRATTADFAAVQAAIRSGKKLWACDAILDEDGDGATGLACDYDANGDDTDEVIGKPVSETSGSPSEIRIRGAVAQ